MFPQEYWLFKRPWYSPVKADPWGTPGALAHPTAINSATNAIAMGLVTVFIFLYLPIYVSATAPAPSSRSSHILLAAATKTRGFVDSISIPLA
jgi:hypothetical protein